MYASLQHNKIASDNGLVPVWHQAINWTSAAKLSIRPQGTYFGELFLKIQKFSYKIMHLKMLSAKWRSFCVGLNELMMIVYAEREMFLLLSKRKYHMVVPSPLIYENKNTKIVLVVGD